MSIAVAINVCGSLTLQLDALQYILASERGRTNYGKFDNIVKASNQRGVRTVI